MFRRSTIRGRRVALPGLCMALTTASLNADVRFQNVAPARALNHAVTYGPPFDFPGDSPGMAAMKRVMQRNMGNGAAVGDYDTDGDDDVYLLGQSGSPNRLYRNDLVNGVRVFTDVTPAAGVGDTGFGRVAHFVDLDDDGWNDLLLINDDDAGGTHSPSRIYRNNRDGTFTDVTAGSGFAPTGLIKGGACVGDYDGDGKLDIYVAFWLMEVGGGVPGFAGSNRLYRNLGDFHFDDVTLAVGFGTLMRDSFSCALADFDNDGDPDLYVAVDHTSDAYYRNDGGTFTDRTVSVGATHTGNDMGIGVRDFDNDGDLDVYSTNITDPGGALGTTQFNTLLVNQLAETGVMTFADQAGPRGVRDTYWGWGTEFADVDNDGDDDLYAVNGFDEWISSLMGPNYVLVDSPEVLFLNDGTGQFTRSSGTGADIVADARAAIAFDSNRDGLLDFLVTSIIDPVALLENRSVATGHWISVKAVGECGSNASAVGARIRVAAGGVTRMREVMVGGSYLSGRPLEQHFGLGDAAVVDRLHVVFPDGTEATWESLPVDRRYAAYHETNASSARLVVSRDLRDAAALQRCMGIGITTAGFSECIALDADANGEIGLGDLPTFLDALEWRLPGCAAH